MSQAVTPYLEMSQAIMDAGGEALKKCYQCGTCSGTCPWTPITHFNIRKLVRYGQLGLDGIEEFMWGCSTCKFCVDRCPRGVELIDVVTAIRNVYSGGGLLPQTLRSFVGSMSARGNPWSGDQTKRNDWTKDKYPLYTKGTEYLFFSCCTVCYESPKCQTGQSRCRSVESNRIELGIDACGCQLLRRELEKGRRSGVIRKAEGQ